jgi:hypothetical protein
MNQRPAAILWGLFVIFVLVFMISRPEPAYFSRPSALDHAFIVAAPLVCAVLAALIPSRGLVWSVIVVVVIGMFCAIQNTTLPSLSVAMHGRGPLIRWWTFCLAWLVIGGRGGAALVWALQDPLAERRQRAGLCPKCGYDLRATPTRCPECGFAAGS